MNLSLVAIEVDAFKNFAEKTTVRLGDLAPGLCFVRGVNHANERLGSNGAGKTTLFSDAVTWCLYGRTVGGLRTTDVRSWLTDRHPRVALTLRADGEEHVVQRGPRATELTVDGKAVGQEDVDALVGAGCEAFEQAVVWGQGRPLFLDRKPAEKMALLSDALGLERWERRAEAAGGRAKRLEASLAALEGELRGLEAAREHAGAALAEAKAATDGWARSHGERVQGLLGAASGALMAADAAEDERGKVDVAGEEIAVKIKLLRPDVGKAREELRQWQAAGLEHSNTLERLDAEEAQIGEHLESFGGDGKCPTCGQAVKKKDADRHVTDLVERQRAIVKSRKTVLKAEADAIFKVGALRTKLVEDEAALAELEALERKQASALITLERRAAQTRAEANAAEAALKAAEQERNPHRDAAADAKKRLREIDAQLKEGDGLAGKFEASIERAQFWVKGFREIRLMVVDEILADLRETTAAVMDDLGLGEWSVDYTTERETKSGTTSRALVALVRAPGAPEGVRWENYSGGEGQRLRLASALALGEVLLAHAGVHIDFRVLDEPTRGLSREGVRDLTEMLAGYAEEAGLRLFYVDHQSAEGLVFTSTITVESDAAGAHVVGGRG